VAKRKSQSFTVKIDSSIKLPGKSRAAIAAAVGGAAAAQLARLDNKSAVAFVHRIDWPGGLVIDLGKYMSDEQLNQALGGF